MARYALVNADGETETVLVWNGVSLYRPPAGCLLVPEAAAPPMATPPSPVPDHVTNLQARAALRRTGCWSKSRRRCRLPAARPWMRGSTPTTSIATAPL